MQCISYKNAWPTSVHDTANLRKQNLAWVIKINNNDNNASFHIYV